MCGLSGVEAPDVQQMVSVADLLLHFGRRHMRLAPVEPHGKFRIFESQRICAVHLIAASAT